VLFFLFSPLGPKLTEREHWLQLLSYLTLTSSWRYTTIDSKALVQFHYGWSWSISTECFFYVIYGLFLYRISRIQNVRHCLLMLIGFCLLSYLLLYGIYRTHDRWEAYVLASHPNYIASSQDFNNSFYRWVIYISPYLQALSFIGGCLTCQLYLLIRDREELRQMARSPLLAKVGIVWILFSVLAMSGALAPDIENNLPGFFKFLHTNFLLAPACYMLILACALEDNFLSEVLSRPAPQFLGEISYSVYLCHLIIPTFAPLAGEEWPTTLRLTFAIMLAIVFAAGLYTVVEVPSKRWLRKML
jgi:peptidoglycan/LPS O-acetylase OafA/YrhL